MMTRGKQRKRSPPPGWRSRLLQSLLSFGSNGKEEGTIQVSSFLFFFSQSDGVTLASKVTTRQRGYRGSISVSLNTSEIFQKRFQCKRNSGAVFSYQCTATANQTSRGCEFSNANKALWILLVAFADISLQATPRIPL
ncbi:hypothetical protein L1887_10952 [Cichorium endivia]|nr:hypothetical protein L1887_10952 [Cichorium endivia]